MTVIDGKRIAERIIGELKTKPRPEKFFAAIVVGEDPASMSFLGRKEKTAKELGVDFRLYRLGAELTNDELRKEVGTIANHKTCGGVIVQLPLPAHLNRHYALNAIPPEKDVDVLGERALGSFYTGRGKVLPPAVGTLAEILRAADRDIKTQKVAAVGLGLLIGKPIATWLMGKARELHLLHRGSDFSILKNVDLVVTGVGKPKVVTPEMLSPGAGVVDYGYSLEGEGDPEGKMRLVGDFDPSTPQSNSGQALQSDSGQASMGQGSFYTPTPGGTGPVLVAKLFENFFLLNSEER